MKPTTCILIFLFGVGSLAFGQEPVTKTQAKSPGIQATDGTLEQKASYVMGFDFVESLKAQQAEISLESLIAGIKAAVEGSEIGMSAEEISTVMSAYEKKCNEKMKAFLLVAAEANLASGQEFLKANATKEGVQTLASGLQYRVVQSGQGAAPVATDTVQVHYTGKLTNGNVFESSVERGEPVTYPVRGFIKGMTEALLKMKIGEKWELVIPSELAYGDKGPDGIGPNQVLVFEVELLGIVK
jgi:FKBP-type peptidyl-prolyl cis-trans isomerase